MANDSSVQWRALPTARASRETHYTRNAQQPAVFYCHPPPLSLQFPPLLLYLYSFIVCPADVILPKSCQSQPHHHQTNIKGECLVFVSASCLQILCTGVRDQGLEAMASRVHRFNQLQGMLGVHKSFVCISCLK